MPAYWGGISAGVLGASYTTSVGTLPGVATLAVHPSNVPRAEKFGDLVLTDDTGGKVRVVGCVLVSGGASAAPAAGTLQLLDRRHAWTQRHVSGRWNDPNDRDPPDPRPRKLRDLLTYLLEQVEETPVFQGVPDVSPPVDWDREPVAAALSALCDAHGLRVCPRTDRYETLIAPAGEGGPLPAGHMGGRHQGIDPPEPPERLELLGAVAEYQCRIDLEPVGLDFDGSIKRLHELSYRPVDDEHWEHSIPPWHVGAIGVGDHSRAEARALARESVFVYYRPTRFAAQGRDVEQVRVDGYGGKGDGPDAWLDWRRVALTDHKVEVKTDPDTGKETPAPPDILGDWWPGTVATAAVEGQGKKQRPPFHVDVARNLVVFHQPMILVHRDGADTTIRPALLQIETAVVIRHSQTNQWERYSKVRTLGGLRGLTRHLVRESVRWGRKAKYAADGGYTGYEDVEDGSRADYYLDAAAREYETVVSDSAGYNTIRGDIQLDGAIQQVTWSVAPGRTHASLNSEHQQYLPAYPERTRLAEFSLEQQRRQKTAFAGVRDRLRYVERTT